MQYTFLVLNLNSE